MCVHMLKAARRQPCELSLGSQIPCLFRQGFSLVGSYFGPRHPPVSFSPGLGLHVPDFDM